MYKNQEADVYSSYNKLESPFLTETITLQPTIESEAKSDPEESIFTTPSSNYETPESPFVLEYSTQQGIYDPDAAAYYEIVQELWDDEFQQSILNLADELAVTVAEHFVAGNGDTLNELFEQERFLTEYLKPLQESMESLLLNLEVEIGDKDVDSVVDQEVDSLIDRFIPETELPSPVIEDFFGGWKKKLKKIWKKTKKVARKVWKKAKHIAKKVMKAIPLPFKFIFRKLRRIVKPLLRRVFKYALNRLPARYRYLAKRLAKMFLREVPGEALIMGETTIILDEDADFLVDPITNDALNSELIQLEFDSIVAGYLIQGEEIESTPVVTEYCSETRDTDEEALIVLDHARETFAQGIVKAQNEQEAEALIENYVTAVLTALRWGIRIVGRKRVVNFLAKAVARLIQRFVGKRTAGPLSRVLVDAGLKLISLEVPEADELTVGYTVAAATESLVEDLFNSTPSSIIENEDLQEDIILEAVDKAIAAHIPNNHVRYDLREADELHGIWIFQPTGRKKKIYKKFSKVVEVKISPRMAAEIQTWGGSTLKTYFRDTLGTWDGKNSINAKMHIYEAILNTQSLKTIAVLERNTLGLGTRKEGIWRQIHPLTKQAAAILLKEAGMGTSFPTRVLLSNHGKTFSRKRYFYLEIIDSFAFAKSALPSQVNISLNLRKHQLSVYLFLSEVETQRIAGKIRSGAPRAALVDGIRTTLRTGLEISLSGGANSHIRLERESVTLEEASTLQPYTLKENLAGSGKIIINYLANFILQEFGKYLKEELKLFSDRFVSAADDPAAGVSIIFQIPAPHLFTIFMSPNIRSAISSAKYGLDLFASFSIEIKPGFHR